MAYGHDTGSETGQETRQAAEDAAQTLRQEGQRLAAGVKAKADRAAADQKRTASGYLTDFSEAVNSLTSTLDAQGHDGVARYTRSAAEELRRMGSSLDARDYKDLARDVGAFAQRNPAVFFGGAFAVGFGVARFLASSRAADRDHEAGPLTASGSSAPQSTYREEVGNHG